MAAVKITKRPSLAVRNLGAPTRGNGNRMMTAVWQVPSDLTNAQRDDRAEGMEIDWYLGVSGTDPKKAYVIANAGQSGSSINLNDLKIGRKTYTRESFYPVTKRVLSYVTVRVTPFNSKGKGKSLIATRHFTKPKPPTIDAISFNTETGVVSTTIRTDAGNGYAERYDTRYKVTVYNSATKKTWNSSDDSSRSTAFRVSYNVGYYQQLGAKQYVKVTVSAWSRGFAGISDVVKRTYYVSYPIAATIKRVGVSSKGVSGKCTVYLKTNWTESHPIDRVMLQYLADVPYRTVDSIPASDEWTSTDIMDDAKCTALAIPVADIMPSAGNYTWLRVKSWHANENVLYKYSNYKRVDKLFTPAPTAEDERVTILSLQAGEDGRSARVHLGWNRNGRDDATGTELSWSDQEDAWKSTESPSTHEFTWSDGSYTTPSGITFQDSAWVTIKKLDEGVKYYVKARRYLDGESGTTYSPYSSTATVIPNDRPESVEAIADRYVPDGAPLDVRWTFSGNGLQRQWQIVKRIEKDGEMVDDVVIADGTGSIGSAQISADRLVSFAEDGELTFNVQASTGSGFVSSEDQVVTIMEPPTLAITDSSFVDGVLVSNDLSITLQSDRVCDLIVNVTSQGASGQFPDGVLMQASGDTVHSDVYSPNWGLYELTEDAEVVDGKMYYTRSGTGTASDPYAYTIVDEPTTSAIGTYYEMVTNDSVTINLPTGLNFWDEGRYTASIVGVDRTTGLRSPEVTLEIPVRWSHQAVAPVQVSYELTADTSVVEDEAYYELVDGEYILVTPEGGENPHAEGWYTQNQTSYVTLTVIDEKDADGDHRQAVQIDLTPPEGSSETDVYDIYRIDIENPTLIGQGFPLTYTAVDEYAPFGKDTELKYRIALRTIDGDVEFSDIEYRADCNYMRFDWAGGSIELPYNLAIGENFEKDADIRRHMNGDINGYWNRGAMRKASLSSDVINLIQAKEIERARLLARYAGPVFVRLPNGAAFEADVQVTDLSKKNAAVVSMAFDATEISLTNEFSLPTPFRLEE